MEYVDVYDLKGRRTGKVIPRFVPMGEGEFFKSVVVCIFNKEGKMLIQQRTWDKKSWPGLWDVSVGGALSAGEDSQEAGMREVEEELGLHIDLSQARPHMITSFSTGFTETYLVEMDVTLDDVTIQKEEVQAVRFATREEIHSMIDAGIFINYKRAWIDMTFECRHGYGTFEMPH